MQTSRTYMKQSAHNTEMVTAGCMSGETVSLFVCTHLKGAHECLVYTHHGSSIVKLPTVVWCRKYCYKLPLSEELIAVFYNLQQRIQDPLWSVD